MIDSKKHNSPSLDSVVLIGIMLFSVWMTIYAVFVFQQFETVKVVAVSTLFLLLVFFLSYVFNKGLFRLKIRFSLKNLFLGLVVLFFLIMFSNPGESWSQGYYPTFPVIRADLLLEISRDTIYDASLVQSIINFGYPSIAQHDAPLTIYHVLSYYVNAFIVTLTGMEVFDSIGLIFHFEIFALVAAVTVFIRRVTSGLHDSAFWVSLIVAVPLIIHWHAILSQPLWVTSLILILSAPKVFDILKSDSLKLNDFIFLFFLVCLISLGKVSSGFMYAVFLGFFLLLKNPKEKLIYFLGTSWILFFLLYYKLYFSSWSASSESSFQMVHISQIVEFLSDVGRLHEIYICLGLFSLLVLLFRSRLSLNMLGAAQASFMVLVFFTQAVSTFGNSDITYFINALRWVFVLFVFQTVMEELKSLDIGKIFVIHFIGEKIQNNYLKIVLSVVVIFAVLNFSNIKERLISLNLTPFSQVNQKLADDEKISLKRVLSNVNADYLSRLNSEEELSMFREGAYTYMDNKNITKKNTLLYIPKEIFENHISKFKTNNYFFGGLIYAVSGVPLIHGIRNLRKGYGFADYDNEALWIAREDFREDEACQYKKNIVIVERWHPLSFSLLKCDIQ